MKKFSAGKITTLFALCLIGLTGCGYNDGYGGGYYGYPGGGWGRQGWGGGYSVGPHYAGRGFGGPGYRNRFNPPRRDDRGRDNHRHDARGRGPGGYQRR